MNYLTSLLRVSLYSTLALFFVQLVPSICFSQTLAIQYLDQAPIVDGLGDDLWESVAFDDIDRANVGQISSQADLTASFKAGWTQSHLYLLVQIKDDVFYSDSENQIWNDDGVEIFIDASNDKKSFYGADDFYFQFRHDDSESHEYKHGNTEGVVFEQSISNDTTIYEIAIPFSLLGISEPSNHKLIGFDVHVNDDDGNGQRDGKVTWYTEFDYSGSNPSYFGIVKLDGQDEGVPTSNPKFSHQRGVYEASFTLGLTSEDNNTEIYCTLDGSDPRFSDSRLNNLNSLEVTIDPSDDEYRGGTTPSVIVRAASKAEGMAWSEVKTHTYIFVDEVIKQSDPNGHWNNPYENHNFPALDDPQTIDYDMDEGITGSSEYKDLMKDALLQIPSYSIVMDYDDMFDSNSGLFMNALTDGWERPTSVEMIDVNQGKDFQVDAGIRIRGRYSRLSRNPKHSFRLLFRKEYGESKFEYPVFEEEGTDKFERLDFRCAQNSSWNNGWHDESTRQSVTFLKEIFSRDAHRQMGYRSTRSSYCHMYLNGMYWGIYQIQERADDNFAESYFGGDKDDYDVIKPQKDVRNPANDLKIGASSGDLTIAQNLWDLAINGFETNEKYFFVQGLNADGTINESQDQLLNIDYLIDYLLLPFYMGSEDGPIVRWTQLWGEKVRPNNFIGYYNKVDKDGFKWMVHDFEKSMYDENDSWPLIEYDSWFPDDFENFNPIRIHRELMENEEYKVRFADRVFRHFENEGTLTSTNVASLIEKRKTQIDQAVVAESARWGDWIDWGETQTHAHWEENVDRILDDYVPKRTDIVLGQFESLGLYTDLKPPLVISSSETLRGVSGIVDLNADIELQLVDGAQGEIYYTLNGKDPRAIGGELSADALLFENNAMLSISTSALLMARVKEGSEWSPLLEFEFQIDDPLSDLKITEIHYHPKVEDGENSEDFEFIEFKNIGNETLDLTGLEISDGVVYEFVNDQILPGEFLILSSSSVSFTERYGFEPDGVYAGHLRNSGERIALQNAAGTTVVEVSYSDDLPWPISPDGLGNSLVPTETNPSGDSDVHSYWRASTNLGGSPGQDDPKLFVSPIVFNEILINPIDSDQQKIELYNPTDSIAHIGYWYLSNDINGTQMWQFPAETTLPAFGYLVVSESDFGNTLTINPHGGDLYLKAANADGQIGGYSDALYYDEYDVATSAGWYVNSQEEKELVALEEMTFGEENAGPKVGPIIFSEINYHPSFGNYEFVKLENISDAKVDLFDNQNTANTWQIEGVDFVFPTDVSLSAGEVVYVIEAGVDIEEFRSWNDLNGDIQIYSMAGKLDNSGEKLSLYKPAATYQEGELTKHEYILIDHVRYDDEQPWEENADGLGATLERVNSASYGNDPTSWHQGKLVPPVIWADSTYAQDGIVLTFDKNGDWSQSISSIFIDETSVSESNYEIFEDHIVLSSSLFESKSACLIKVVATGYYDSSVEQVIGTFLAAEADKTALLHIYPNPSSGTVTLDFGRVHGAASLTVFDLAGHIYHQIEIEEEQHRTTIDLQKKGVYIIRLEMNNSTQSYKVFRY
ncbi:MAG: lamin tail domain-containing protein [Reichenbachiella sp.]